ncbi:MAG: sigma-54-dependent Fis family transcriptional regulator [Rhodobacteraceae bacterium]|nr:sigma-54-dependent Fis family transcriptional regulator [Paracoccaceae bacterium]
MRGRILIVEGRGKLLSSLTRQLEQQGYTVDLAHNLPKAAELFATCGHAIVIVDLLISEHGVKPVIGGMLGARPQTRIIVTTASGSMKQAADAMKLGAFDFIVKPFDSERLVHFVNNAARVPDAGNPAAEPSRLARGYLDMDSTVHKFIAKIAPSLATVLITGPKGVMKEACARLIHTRSSLREGAFTVLECQKGRAGEFYDYLPKDLFQSGGTVFFNDICDLPLRVQTQLLWFLQTGLVKDAEGVTQRPDIRMICGTSLPPEAAMSAGRLREDLYYRLSVASLALPGLTDGRFSVRVMAQELFSAYCRVIGRGNCVLGPDVCDMFEQYSWPGQQAELVKLLRSLADSAPSGEVTPAHLPRSFLKAFRQDQTEFARSQQEAAAGSQNQTDVYEAALRALIRDGLTLAEIEKSVIEVTIRHYQGSIPRAAAHLGVSPSTLYRKLESWSKS